MRVCVCVTENSELHALPEFCLFWTVLCSPTWVPGTERSSKAPTTVGQRLLWGQRQGGGPGRPRSPSRSVSCCLRDPTEGPPLSGPGGVPRVPPGLELRLVTFSSSCRSGPLHPQSTTDGLLAGTGLPPQGFQPVRVELCCEHPSGRSPAAAHSRGAGAATPALPARSPGCQPLSPGRSTVSRPLCRPLLCARLGPEPWNSVQFGDRPPQLLEGNRHQCGCTGHRGRLIEDQPHSCCLLTALASPPTLTACSSRGRGRSHVAPWAVGLLLPPSMSSRLCPASANPIPNSTRARVWLSKGS